MDWWATPRPLSPTSVAVTPHGQPELLNNWRQSLFSSFFIYRVTHESRHRTMHYKYDMIQNTNVKTLCTNFSPHRHNQLPFLLLGKKISKLQIVLASSANFKTFQILEKRWKKCTQFDKNKLQTIINADAYRTCIHTPKRFKILVAIYNC